MKRNADLYLKLTIALLLVFSVIYSVNMSFRYIKTERAIEALTDDVEKLRQSRAEWLARDIHGLDEEATERVFRERKPPSPIEVHDYIVFFTREEGL